MWNDLEVCFRAGFIAEEACGSHAGDAPEAGPAVSLLKPAAILDDLATADFKAALTLIGVFVRGQVCIFWRSLEEEAHVVLLQALMALSCRGII